MLIIRQLNKSGPNIEDQGHSTDYVRVNSKKTHDGIYKLHNHFLHQDGSGQGVTLAACFCDSTKLMGTSTITQPWAS
ncbi:hypothetical protein ACHAW6_000488 [Cyclotella cf. meneghiniana]